MKLQLADLAYARSGDKGDLSNIGLMAFNKGAYEIIKREVTPEKVKDFFGDMVKGEVVIYDLPNLNALEITMQGALGGGATKTLRFDQTGKSMGCALLRMKVEVNN